ncbi:MAG: aldo/keto reductase [Burkholderiales bacterium]|nr:aldo/keto reductase [Burkholderiales bacterium]
MTCDPGTDARRPSRREWLKLAAGVAAAVALPRGAALAAAPVRTRPIPRTGEPLPVIGLGTAIVFDIGEDAAQRAERGAVIRTLLEGGGRVIDTAPSYGSAESVLGDLLAQMKLRDQVFLSTKFSRAGRDGATAEMRESQRRLRTDRFDVMLRHNIGFVDREASAGHFALLREWKQQGICRYIGATHSQDQERANERLIEIMKQEKPDFMQVNYSLAERSVEARLLGTARDTGTAIMVNLPFARARLFRAVRGRELPDWAKAFEAVTWGQFFLKYLLAHEAVTCVLPGTDRTEHMLDNLGAGRGRLPDAAMRRGMAGFVDALG